METFSYVWKFSSKFSLLQLAFWFQNFLQAEKKS